MTAFRFYISWFGFDLFLFSPVIEKIHQNKIELTIFFFFWRIKVTYLYVFGLGFFIFYVNSTVGVVYLYSARLTFSDPIYFCLVRYFVIEMKIGMLAWVWDLFNIWSSVVHLLFSFQILMIPGKKPSIKNIYLHKWFRILMTEFG